MALSDDDVWNQRTPRKSKGAWNDVDLRRRCSHKINRGERGRGRGCACRRDLVLDVPPIQMRYIVSNMVGKEIVLYQGESSAQRAEEYVVPTTMESTDEDIDHGDKSADAIGEDIIVAVVERVR